MYNCIIFNSWHLCSFYHWLYYYNSYFTIFVSPFPCYTNGDKKSSNFLIEFSFEIITYNMVRYKCKIQTKKTRLVILFQNDIILRMFKEPILLEKLLFFSIVFFEQTKITLPSNLSTTTAVLCSNNNIFCFVSSFPH